MIIFKILCIPIFAIDNKFKNIKLTKLTDIIIWQKQYVLQYIENIMSFIKSNIMINLKNIFIIVDELHKLPNEIYIEFIKIVIEYSNNILYCQFIDIFNLTFFLKKLNNLDRMPSVLLLDLSYINLGTIRNIGLELSHLLTKYKETKILFRHVTYSIKNKNNISLLTDLFNDINFLSHSTPTLTHKINLSQACIYYLFPIHNNLKEDQLYDIEQIIFDNLNNISYDPKTKSIKE